MSCAFGAKSTFVFPAFSATVPCQALALALLASFNALAGQLFIRNASQSPIACTVDGYTKASGATADSLFRIAPGQKVGIAVSPQAKGGVLNTASCGGLNVRALNMTMGGSDRTLLLNGRQRRVLNALLYASIPTDPKIGYFPLVQHLTDLYQAAHPEVLLNLVLDSAIDVYNFANLKSNVLASNGFDTVELDTVFLKWLKDGGLIRTAHIAGDEPWPVAKQAVTINGEIYGVPSWLCSDFLFSSDGAVKDVQTFGQMKSLMAKTPSGLRELVGDFDGSWTIPSEYIQAYVQTHAGSSPVDAAAAPIDAAVVARMSALGAYCVHSGADPCIDGTYHAGDDGVVEKAYVSEPAANDTGFSERSFFIALYRNKPMPLWLVPVPWGDRASGPKLVYTDAFVTNRATCGAAPCEPDATGFAAFMTSVPIRKYIALSGDLPVQSPARHLIVTAKAFYDDREVKGDPIYTQIMTGFLKADIHPYLTSFTPQLQYDLLSGICPVLVGNSPSWKCKVPTKP